MEEARLQVATQSYSCSVWSSSKSAGLLGAWQCTLTVVVAKGKMDGDGNIPGQAAQQRDHGTTCNRLNVSKVPHTSRIKRYGFISDEKIGTSRVRRSRLFQCILWRRGAAPLVSQVRSGGERTLRITHGAPARFSIGHAHTDHARVGRPYSTE